MRGSSENLHQLRFLESVESQVKSFLVRVGGNRTFLFYGYLWDI
jgi:hypothetical protein